MTSCRRLCLLTLIAAFGTAAPVLADCVPTPAKTVFEERQRIGDCLASVARAPVRNAKDERDNEVRLYTWGPDVKIKGMLDDPEFCEYEFERQREFELRNFVSAWSENTAPWYDAAKVTGVHQIDQLAISRPDKQALSLLFVFEGMPKSSMTLAARQAETQRTLAALETTGNAVELARWRGREAAQGMPPDSRSSSIKTGRGVYFATDPYAYFSTVDGRLHGLVCDLPETAEIIDLANGDTQKALEKTAIMHPKPGDLFASGMVPFINNPRLFDEAARGRHVVRARFPKATGPGDQVWVDKCSIQYTGCRRVSLREQDLSCTDFRRLLGVVQRDSGAWAAVDKPLAAPDELLDLFIASDKAAETFSLRLSTCFSSRDGEGLEDALTEAGREKLVKAFLKPAGQ